METSGNFSFETIKTCNEKNLHIHLKMHEGVQRCSKLRMNVHVWKGSFELDFEANISERLCDIGQVIVFFDSQFLHIMGTKYLTEEIILMTYIR